MSNPVGITFRETMSGGFMLGVQDTADGQSKGRSHGSELALHGTIEVDDIDRFIAEPGHAGKLSGTIDFTPWGEGLVAPTGVFNLFKPSDSQGLKYMVYEMAFEYGGKPYYLAGKKDVEDQLLKLWEQTTTLYTHLHEGHDKSGPIVGAGILTLGVKELIKLVSTFHPVNAPDAKAGADAVAKFGKFFLGELWDSYVKK